MHKQFLFITLLFLSVIFSVSAQNEESDLLNQAEKYQEELNKEFSDEETTPLQTKDLKKFKELDFFELDPAYIIEAKFIRTPYESPFAMPTTTDRKAIYIKYGEVKFRLHNQQVSLNVYQNQRLMTDPEYKDHLFIPFTDATNGNETYAGGRYLDITIPKGPNVLLDFNQAYNPYCAYNGRYSCPIPPEENDMQIPIKAGVKKFK
ncbi:DUF1684 domain-containing protein [Mesonia aquimarina]|uniref:DUF1684 domain-containing protein n=1 Tax=Mesonia aquimarina TaxID=1504967 RepID=UPI000EF55E67|nr:DUF1684 domain-containing protein [Mesonia aquimarina]